MAKGTHFADQDQVINQAELDNVNEKLRHEGSDDQNSDTTSDHEKTNATNGAHANGANGNGEKLEQLGTYDRCK